MIKNKKLWDSFVNLSTRISYRSWSKGCQIKLALDSLYSLMQILRNNLSEDQDQDFIHFRLIFPYLNTTLGPFLAYWHNETKSLKEGELSDDVRECFREDLLKLQKDTYELLKQINHNYNYCDEELFVDIFKWF